LVEQGEQTFETYSAAAVVESGRSDDIEQLRQRRLRRLVGQAAVNETAESRNEFDTPGFDPIGSARRYLETQTKDNYRAVLADAETALLEAMSTRSVELFPTYTARWNGEAFAIGQQTIEGVAANGMQNDVRTKAEYLEAVTPAELVKMGLDQTYGALTVSTQHRPNHAPVTMLRYSEVKRDSAGIFLHTQQMSIPNQTHTPELIAEFFEGFSIDYDNQRDSVEQTILVKRELGEKHSVDQFGEQIEDLSAAADMFYKKTDYSQLKSQAASRRQLIKNAAVEMAAETIRLAQENLHPVIVASELDDKTDSKGQVRLGLRSQILMKHLHDKPDVAEVVFGEVAANNLRQAQTADNDQIKQKYIKRAVETAKETKACTVGSCGIEQSDSTAAAEVRSIIGMNGEVVYYPKSKCRACGKVGNVHYLRNKNGDYACCLSCENSKKL